MGTGNPSLDLANHDGVHHSPMCLLTVNFGMLTLNFMYNDGESIISQLINLGGSLNRK